MKAFLRYKQNIVTRIEIFVRKKISFEERHDGI